METPAPPPPGTEETLLPPPPGDEVHESDVLKRRKKFSWKQFGGDGFLASVAFHVILLLLALFYVIKKYTEPKKPDTEVFATGSGGGANGDLVKQFEHKMQRKISTPLKTPSRIVSKSANAALSLPSTPNTSSVSFASGLSTGGMSKGSGGGTGGGEGTGIGIGKGGGRNFVSLFGGRNLANGLTGTYYDVKYRRQPDSDGKLSPSDLWQSPPTWHSPDNISFTAAFPGKSGNKTPDADRYYKLIARIADGGSAESVLSDYFSSPTKLNASQMWIPGTPSAKSPEAFEVGDKCGAHYWIVSYRGKISPPSSGRWRFVGAGDDVMVCKIDGKPAMAWFWWWKPYLHHVWAGAPRGSKGVPDRTKLLHYPGLGGYGEPAGVGVGNWIEMTKGSWYDCEIVIGDWGGAFAGFLLCEKEGESYGKAGGAPILPLFRTSAEMPANPGPGLPPYMADGPIWGVKSPAPGLVR